VVRNHRAAASPESRLAGRASPRLPVGAPHVFHPPIRQERNGSSRDRHLQASPSGVTHSVSSSRPRLSAPVSTSERWVNQVARAQRSVRCAEGGPPCPSKDGARSENASTTTSRTVSDSAGGRKTWPRKSRHERSTKNGPAMASPKTASRASTEDISSGRRGGLRSHRGSGGRTRAQLYEEARHRGIKGRSKMSKAQLESAVER